MARVHTVTHEKTIPAAQSLFVALRKTCAGSVYDMEALIILLGSFGKIIKKNLCKQYVSIFLEALTVVTSRLAKEYAVHPNTRSTERAQTASRKIVYS